MKKRLYGAALVCSMTVMLLSMTSFAGDNNISGGVVVAKTGVELIGSVSSTSGDGNNAASSNHDRYAYAYYNGGIATDGSTQSYVYYNGRYTADGQGIGYNYYNGGLNTEVDTTKYSYYNRGNSF